MSRKTLPTNEAKIGLKIFVRPSEIEALKKIESGEMLVDEMPALWETRDAICERVIFAFECHREANHSATDGTDGTDSSSVKSVSSVAQRNRK